MSTPLIRILSSAIDSRRRALMFGWSRRTDHEATRRAVMICEQFVISYPGASDALVMSWCRENSQHVSRVILGNRVKILQQLIPS